MKNIFTDEFAKYAIKHPVLGMPIEGRGGVYSVPLKNSKGKSVTLQVCASIDMDWDQVSVSLPHRCPNWPEMDFIKKMFFEEDEVAFQLHVSIKDHINIHDYCLHLWRPQNQDIPLPEKLMV